jgi:hypothetical protein
MKIRDLCEKFDNANGDVVINILENGEYKGNFTTKSRDFIKDEILDKEIETYSFKRSYPYMAPTIVVNIIETDSSEIEETDKENNNEEKDEDLQGDV